MALRKNPLTIKEIHDNINMAVGIFSRHKWKYPEVSVVDIMQVVTLRGVAITDAKYGIKYGLFVPSNERTIRGPWGHKIDICDCTLTERGAEIVLALLVLE